ncbi:putative DNA-binding domain-containing protein [Devosia sp. XJ19-1]|uniref:DNA-binding domain-containing protein n=1 Tax=Devosia ureilytica TaxID=2952754 RepID=A0A9Q4FUK7_9HYPH|nr:DNA-binding domain-containing protein [Devosia ureilytica]MCP8885212.1 putative DNA-binding domain-containing protein [Devosia ureilytica]MCP8888670.1 putative DNA-binding domain-containing protein [Devosia ureilytica]
MTDEAQFVAALTDPTRAVPAGLVSPRGTTDAKRFAVYRNNVHVSLTAALAARFPVTRMVVGDDFFAGMARLHVGQTKPTTPVLLHYGDSFADFIAGFPPASELPYLPDLARLEAAWSDSYNAADIGGLSPTGLAAMAPETLADLSLALAPAARLISSAYPVGSIWSAHQQVPFVPPKQSGTEHVLLTRPQADVRLTIIPPAAAALLRALADGLTLGAAADAVFATHPDFDPGSALVGLAGLGAFAAPQQELSR